MSTEHEDPSLPVRMIETRQESPQKSKILYTRDFLLSLSELDVCKELPSGVDLSVLSEFEDPCNNLSERPKIPGSFSSQSFRRSEYGSSPPTRGDYGSYSRGVHGRWDSRSSGSNDRDGDSQSDLESDSGRRGGNQSRRSWQNPEHDGLLGSGAFPRPSGYSAGSSAPKVRGNGHYQLNRSDEPYHPPRPYKAAPHSRRDATDSFNDETFGSSECSSQDRAEEERKRRASFELFRKENQRAFHDKQQQFQIKHKEKFDSDITTLVVDSEDDKNLWDKNKVSEDVVPAASQSDLAKCSFPTQTSVSRPLVPPGFTSTNLGAKSLNVNPASEVGNIGLEDNVTSTKGNLMENGILDNFEDTKSVVHMGSLTEQEYDIKNVHIPVMDVIEKMVIPSTDVEISDNSAGVVNPAYKTSNLSEAYEGRSDGEVSDVESEKLTRQKIIGTAGQEPSTSVLDKLFGNALIVKSSSSSNFIERNDVKTDDTWNHTPFHSSKFAPWFLEEEKKPADLSSGKTKDLLSMIVSGEKGGSQVSDEKASEHVPPIFPFESNELKREIKAFPATSATVGTLEPLHHCNDPDATPVLTCEDLEQSILSGINENSSNLQDPNQAWSICNANTERPKAEINDHASQHLLSLLQKGTSLNTLATSPNVDVESSDKLLVHEVGDASTILKRSSEGDAEKVHNSEKILTLETLFGTAFMKELYSVGAPVSVQRGSLSAPTRNDALVPQEFPFPIADDDFFPSEVREYGPNKAALEGDLLASNCRTPKSDEIEFPWLGFDAPRTRMVSKHNAAGGFETRAMDIQLPEEESLITIGDPMHPKNSMIMPRGNMATVGLLSSSNMPVDITDKLAGLNAILKDERSMVRGLDGQHFLHGPNVPVEPEIPYQNQHSGLPSRFPHPQMNHGRPLLQQLDPHHAHMNPQTKIMGPESIIHHDSLSSHQFPSNFFHAPSLQHAPGGPPRFEPHANHPMLQHMHMPGNFPPPHLLQGLPRGAPLPPHPGNHMAGYVPELNPMQGFPLHHRQPSYGGPGMAMPAPGVDGGGSNHPEALERLIAMELRANSKQMHTAAAPHNPAAYNHEVDMSFRYR